MGETAFGVRRRVAALGSADASARSKDATARSDAAPTRAGTGHRDAPSESGDASPQSKDWPHAPMHRLAEAGAYIVTAGTYQKQHHLNTPQRLDLVMHSLFECAQEFGWELDAWAVLSNHYHFVGQTGGNPQNLRRLIGKLHMTSAQALNEADGTPGRKVWFQYWDSLITYERSYLARLKYVHFNPVHHGVTQNAKTYRWCSAAWFESVASPAFVKTVESFKIDRLQVYDPF